MLNLVKLSELCTMDTHYITNARYMRKLLRGVSIKDDLRVVHAIACTGRGSFWAWLGWWLRGVSYIERRIDNFEAADIFLARFIRMISIDNDSINIVIIILFAQLCSCQLSVVVLIKKWMNLSTILQFFLLASSSYGLILNFKLVCF